jgi:hypothetical protein
MTITNEMGFFAVVPLWVLERLVETEQPEALRLYVGLSNWTSGDARSCHPSRQTIADYIGCSTKTVSRHTAALEEIGALAVSPRFTAAGDPTSNSYRLLVSLPLDTGVPTPLDTSVPTPMDTGVPLSNTHLEVDPIEVEIHAPSQAIVLSAAPQFPTLETELDCFDLFWETYGKIGPRKKALECWSTARRRDNAANIQSGLESWVEYWQSPGSAAIKWPQGWLNNDTWKDNPPQVRQASAPLSKSTSALKAAMQNRMQT